MKLLIMATVLMASQAFGQIPSGLYKVDSIKCKTGKVMKLGGKFMTYEIYLDVAQSSMKMTARAKSGSWAPFKLDCTQTNEGTFTYTQEGKFEGELPNTAVSCNASAWESILKKKLFGVEEFGEFTYTVNADKLTIFNPNTVTKYSCDKAGDYPIYEYTKL